MYCYLLLNFSLSAPKQHISVFRNTPNCSSVQSGMNTLSQRLLLKVVSGSDSSCRILFSEVEFSDFFFRKSSFLFWFLPNWDGLSFFLFLSTSFGGCPLCKALLGKNDDSWPKDCRIPSGVPCHCCAPFHTVASSFNRHFTWWPCCCWLGCNFGLLYCWKIGKPWKIETCLLDFETQPCQ